MIEVAIEPWGTAVFQGWRLTRDSRSPRSEVGGDLEGRAWSQVSRPVSGPDQVKVKDGGAAGGTTVQSLLAACLTHWEEGTWKQ